MNIPYIANIRIFLIRGVPHVRRVSVENVMIPDMVMPSDMPKTVSMSQLANWARGCGDLLTLQDRVKIVAWCGAVASVGFVWSTGHTKTEIAIRGGAELLSDVTVHVRRAIPDAGERRRIYTEVCDFLGDEKLLNSMA